MKMLFAATEPGGMSLVAPQKRQRWQVSALTPLACALFCLFATATARAEPKHTAPTNFDIEALKARGIDPGLVEFFKDSPRFTQGAHPITLKLNGNTIGRVEAQFNKDGSLCFDDALLSRARLRTPDPAHALPVVNDAAPACYDFKAAYPQTDIVLRPNREEVIIVAPQEALLVDQGPTTDFSRGGFAAIANYDVTGVRSTFDSGTTQYLSASTLVGFNMGDWIVRSRQIYTKDGDTSNFEHAYAYAQRTFVDRKAVVQAGQINISSPLFSGAPITGVQMLPETALNAMTHSMALVQGIAQSQATVEVRQSGVLIFTTLVPEGPFALTDIPLLNTNMDLNVTVRETGGAERHFTVSAASFRTSVPAVPGYAFAAGKVRDVGNSAGAEPWVVTGSGTWALNSDISATAGMMASSRFQALGWGADATIGRDAAVTVRNVLSNELNEGLRGAQVSAAVTLPLTENVSTSLSATQRTSGYRELSDSLVQTDSRWNRYGFKSQQTASVRWSNDTVGGLNLTYASNTRQDGRSSDRLVGSWGKSFKDFSVSASVETALGSNGNRGGNDRAAYLNVSIPLGKRSVQSYTRVRENNVASGVAMSEVVNDQMNYRVAVERNNSTGATYANGNVSVLPRYTSVDLAYSHSNAAQSYSGRLTGGAVVHKDGVTFSPYEVQDTFGIVHVPKVSGVKLATPNGPVWTDFSGKAVVSQLTPYRDSRIEVDTKTLPRRVDLKNGFQNLGAGRGSVNFMTFDSISAQRYLVSAVDAAGQPLPKGSLVLDESAKYVTTVLDKGALFLADAKPDAVLTVTLPSKQKCTLDINFSKETDNDAFYDATTAVCR